MLSKDDEPIIYYDIVGETMQCEMQCSPEAFCGLLEDVDDSLFVEVANYMTRRDNWGTSITTAFGRPRLMRRMYGALRRYLITHDGLIIHEDQYRAGTSGLIVPNSVVPTVMSAEGLVTCLLIDLTGQRHMYYLHDLLGRTFYNILENAVFHHLDDDPTFNHFQNIGVIYVPKI